MKKATMTSQEMKRKRMASQEGRDDRMMVTQTKRHTAVPPQRPSSRNLSLRELFDASL
jgi:hypothetical protein